MRFLSLLASGAYLSSSVCASPVVEITNQLIQRDIFSRATFAYQGCYSEGTTGGIGAGKALVNKTVAAPGGGMTVEYCAQSCAGYVLFGVEQATCYCGNRLEAGVLPVSASANPTCDVPCAGDNTQICGAFQKLSIFLISGTGAPGPQGIQGLTGANGAAGAKGASGTNGLNGAPGNNGAPGPTGSAGPPGPSGTTGPQGPAGASGLPGAAGAAGAAGIQGLNGANGANGLSGQAGAPGGKGDKGDPGSNGINGAPGNPGQAGQLGATGAQGQVGTTGAAGADGAQGLTGATGDTGPQGPIGPCRPVGRDMGFEAIGTSDYDIPWEVSPGFTANGAVYNFASGLDPNSGNQHALIDYTPTAALVGKFQQQGIQLCPGTTYTWTSFLKWTATVASPTAPLCAVYFYIGTDAGGYVELATFPERVAPGPIPPEALPAVYTLFTGTYVAGAGDEDDLLVIELDCNDPANTNLGFISFDTFRLAPLGL